MLGCGRIVLDFHSQSAYVDINYLLFAEVVAAPDFFENIRSRKRRVLVCEKVFHYLELDLREFYRDAVLGKCPVPHIEFKLAGGYNIRVGAVRKPGAHLYAAIEHIDASHEFRRRKRLCDIVICAYEQS